MNHNPSHHKDFRHYAAKRQAVLRRIRQLDLYCRQLEDVVKAMPASNEQAGYLDLDNIEQLRADLDEAIETLCDWESLGAEMDRLCVDC